MTPSRASHDGESPRLKSGGQVFDKSVNLWAFRVPCVGVGARNVPGTDHVQQHGSPRSTAFRGNRSSPGVVMYISCSCKDLRFFIAGRWRWNRENHRISRQLKRWRAKGGEGGEQKNSIWSLPNRGRSPPTL